MSKEQRIVIMGSCMGVILMVVVIFWLSQDDPPPPPVSMTLQDIAEELEKKPKSLIAESPATSPRQLDLAIELLRRRHTAPLHLQNTAIEEGARHIRGSLYSDDAQQQVKALNSIVNNENIKAKLKGDVKQMQKVAQAYNEQLGRSFYSIHQNGDEVIIHRNFSMKPLSMEK